MVAFYNSFPKSGKNILNLHLNIERENHITLFDDNKEFWSPEIIISKMETFDGDFTGHVPFYSEVENYLRERQCRIVFLHRDLRDVSLSLARYVETWK